jgi:hypothetical protein
MFVGIRASSSTTLLLATVILFSTAVSAQQVPKELQPPASEQQLFQVHAKGDQIYSCQAAGDKFSWTLKAPDAQLTGQNGKPFGKHFAGPSWQAGDGSRVTGKAVATAPSPDADSIPWLLVTVIDRRGDGVLARVTSVQRINTKNGKAPSSGCDGAHLGAEYRSSYSADYAFFAPK